MEIVVFEVKIAIKADSLIFAYGTSWILVRFPSPKKINVMHQKVAKTWKKCFGMRPTRWIIVSVEKTRSKVDIFCLITSVWCQFLVFKLTIWCQVLLVSSLLVKGVVLFITRLGISYYQFNGITAFTARFANQLRRELFWRRLIRDGTLADSVFRIWCDRI